MFGLPDDFLRDARKAALDDQMDATARAYAQRVLRLYTIFLEVGLPEEVARDFLRVLFQQTVSAS